MDRATPVQLRKALELANMLVRSGVLFVPMPVDNEDEFFDGVTILMKRLGYMADQIESGEQ